MKKLSIILISFIFIFKISSANTYSSDPQMFIEELINDAVNKLSDKNIKWFESTEKGLVQAKNFVISKIN